MNAQIHEPLVIEPARRAPVGIVIGDANGIGPEVVAKSWASGRLHQVCRPILIGSAAAMERAVAALGLDLRVRAIAAPDMAQADPQVYGQLTERDRFCTLRSKGLENSA